MGITKVSELKMPDIEKIRTHVIDKVPRYSYLNAKGNKSQYRYWKFRLADWLMEGKLMGTVKWFNELLEILRTD